MSYKCWRHRRDLHHAFKPLKGSFLLHRRLHHIRTQRVELRFLGSKPNVLPVKLYPIGATEENWTLISWVETTHTTIVLLSHFREAGLEPTLRTSKVRKLPFIVFPVFWGVLGNWTHLALSQRAVQTTTLRTHYH